MPTTVNGIGTHYYCKSNLDTRQGVCEHCGRSGELRAYDTWHCFCVLYIPLIPLGKKRILDDCPSCRRHSVMKAADWEEARGSAIREATAAYEAAPDDPGKAIALHAVLSSGGERQAADELAVRLRKRFASEVDVQLYLGGAHEEVGRHDLSNECFHRAYEVDAENPTAQHASAVALLREGKPEAARARLEEFERSGEAADPGLTFAIASALQHNDPSAAGELLKKVGESAPQLRRDKNFRKLAKQVEQTTGEERGAIAPPVAFWQTKPFWFGVAAVAVLACGVAYDVHTANNQRLVVVNGLPRAIQVIVDEGEAVTVQQGDWRQLTVASGPHTAQLEMPEELAGAIEFEVQAGRLNRWFGKPVHVLDPTHSAVVLWEEVVYSEEPVEEDSPYEISVGQTLKTFNHADYLFVEFPDEIEIDQSKVRKSRVSVAEVSPLALVMNDSVWLEDPSFLDYLESNLRFESDREELLSLYLSAVIRHEATPRAVAFLETGIDEKPIDVHWHRSYQQLAESSGDKGVPQRYDALLAESPDDADLLYLRARIENYHDTSEAFYARCLEADPDHLMTLIGKAYGDMTVGDFAAASALADRALEVEPDNDRARELHADLLIALGQQGVLEEELAGAFEEPPFNLFATKKLMESAASRGDLASARETQNAFVAKVRADWPEDPYQLSQTTEIRLKRLEGDYAAAGAVGASLEDERARDQAKLLFALLGDEPHDTNGWDALIEKTQPLNHAESWLWVSLAAKTRGDEVTSTAARERAAEEFAESGGSPGEVGRLLSDELEGRALALRTYLLETDPHIKAALLLLVADRVGDDGARLVGLAERLSRLPSEHQPLIKAALAARQGS